MSKRFIVPLPGLITTDGKQQYLTNKGGTWFASRRDGNLRQTWKWEHLDYIPEVYRQFAVDLMDYVPGICWKPAMELEDLMDKKMEDKMEERKKIFRFVIDNQWIAYGSIVSRFGPVKNLEDAKREILTSDFITIEGAGGKTLIATKHIGAVEEV